MSAKNSAPASTSNPGAKTTELPPKNSMSLPVGMITLPTVPVNTLDENVFVVDRTNGFIFLGLMI